MKTKITYRYFVLVVTISGFMLLSGNSFAQQNKEDQAKSKKTITIHVTKEVDGNTLVIDTTIVTEGDFDVDAFLDEKGVQSDIHEGFSNTEEDIVIRHPDEEEFNLSAFDGNSPDTIVINDDRVIVLNNNFDMPYPPPPHQGMPFDHNFAMPQEFSHMEGQQFEDMFNDMARSFGLDDVMPFGDMRQIVVKKKHKGKKIIITFEDREGKCDERGRGNKKKEKVIINEAFDKTAPVQKQKQVIIIKDRKTK